MPSNNQSFSTKMTQIEVIKDAYILIMHMVIFVRICNGCIHVKVIS